MKYLRLFSLLVVILPLWSWAGDFNVSIVDFGAVPDGKTVNTAAIQKAIDRVHENGGGRVEVPAGRFLTGSVIMKTGVELHLKRKAILLGSIDPSHYKGLNRWKALILADGSDNISITGRGVIDGQGDELALWIDSLFFIGELDSSQYNLVEGRPMHQVRPQLIEMVDCDNVLIKNVTLKDASCWVQTYEICQGLVIEGVTVDSDAYWNNDGIDVVDCRNVRISDCDINASDDGICLKSEEWDLTEYCDSILIENCRVRSSASAVKLGTSSVSAIKNVIIKNIRVYDTYRSAIAIESVQGGLIENILVDGIKATNTGNALFIRVGQIRNARKPGILRNVIIRNMKVTVPFLQADYQYTIRGPQLPFFHNVIPSSITGLPGHPVENVVLEDIVIIYPGRGSKAYANMPLWRLDDVPELPNAYPEFSMFGELPAWGLYVRHVDGLTMKNVRLKAKEPDYRPAVVYDDVVKLNNAGLRVIGLRNNQVFH
jgi:hypothetical protein